MYICIYIYIYIYQILQSALQASDNLFCNLGNRSEVSKETAKNYTKAPFAFLLVFQFYFETKKKH